MVIEDETTERTVVKRLSLRSRGGELLILDALRSEYADVESKMVRVYDYSRGIYVLLGV